MSCPGLPKPNRSSCREHSLLAHIQIPVCQFDRSSPVHLGDEEARPVASYQVPKLANFSDRLCSSSLSSMIRNSIIHLYIESLKTNKGCVCSPCLVATGSFPLERLIQNRFRRRRLFLIFRSAHSGPHSAKIEMIRYWCINDCTCGAIVNKKISSLRLVLYHVCILLFY